jgi:hypothetical protein
MFKAWQKPTLKSAIMGTTLGDTQPRKFALLASHQGPTGHQDTDAQQGK